MTVEQKLLVISCFAYTVAGAETLESFFHHGNNREVYKVEIAKVYGTLLLAPGHIDMLHSVVKNNTFIGNALGVRSSAAPSSTPLPGVG